MELNVEEFLKEQERKRLEELSSTEESTAGRIREMPADEETASTGKKRVPRSARQRAAVRFVNLKIPETVASRLQLLQVYLREETLERQSLGAIIDRLITEGVQAAYGEKIARKVQKK